MDRSRIARLLRLITLLQSGRHFSAVDLMVELDISRRTLFRDFTVLKEAGVPVYHDPKRGYVVRSGFYLPPVNLTVPETLGLMLLAKSAASQRNRPLTSSALSAIYKLVTTVPEPIRAACSEMMSGVSVDAGASLQGEEESTHYATLQRRVDERRRCNCVYQGPLDAESFETELRPYLLHFAGRAWYVIAYSSLHKAVRTFKLIRFIKIEPGKQTFNRPDGFLASDHLGKAWQIIPEGREYNVELLFDPRVATNVTEVRWHATQQHEMLSDGRCRMTFTVDGLNEIAWWICGYADQVEVKKPAALRKRVHEMLKRAAERYQ